jgi:hypothetical protein
MRRWTGSLVIALVVATCGVLAQEKPSQEKPSQPKPSGIKPCDDLKQEIEGKLTAKGVKGYTLEIVATDQVKDQKVVGSCEGGTKKITYTREHAAPAAKK